MKPCHSLDSMLYPIHSDLNLTVSIEVIAFFCEPTDHDDQKIYEFRPIEF